MQDSPKQSGISLVRVNTEKELANYDLDTLAFDLFGKPVMRMFPIYLVFYHGTLRGYFHAVQQLVVYPALHPDRMTPREFMKISRNLVTEFKRMSGNPLFLLCEQATKLGAKNMHRIRLKKANEEAFVYTEEEH